MLIEFIKTNKPLHVVSNSFLGGNTRRRSRGGHINGCLSGLMTRTGIRVSGDSAVQFSRGCRLHKCRIFIQGSGNILTIEPGAVLEETLLWIVGNNNKMTIGENVTLIRCELGMEHDTNVIDLHTGVQLGGSMLLGHKRNHTNRVTMYVSEGSGITVGEGSAVAEGVTFRTSDSHPIYGPDGERINNAKSITVGRGVWIGSGASLLKGAAVGDGSILGYKSMLTKDFSGNKNVILAGSPAKLMREDIRWTF